MAFLGTLLPTLPDAAKGIGQALEEQLPAVLSVMLSEIDADIERQALTSSRPPTPTEQESCSCSTCGSTCCD